MFLTETGLAKVFQRVRSFVASQLNSKASAIHTHTSSDITDLTVDTTLDGTSSNAISNSAVSNALDGKIPKAGGAVITGTNIGRADNTGGLDICGGTTFENGGFVALHGKNTNVTGQEGAVVIGTNNGSSSCNLTLLPNGTATWGNKEIDTIEEQGDGYIRYSNGLQICWGNMNFGSIEAGGTRDWVLTFPKSFVNSNYIAVCGNSSTGSNWMNNCFITYNCKTTSVNVAVTNLASASSANALASLVTIGKWK